MNNLRLKALLGAGCFSLAMIGSVVTPANAGGLERGWYDIDLLFDPAQITGEVTGTYVMPQRDLKNVKDSNPADGPLNALGFSNSARDTESYWVPSAGIKAGVGPIDCLFDYGQPIGAYSNPGANWAGANGNIVTKVKSEALGGTCSYKMDLGKGQFRFIGGVFHEDVSGFKEQLVAPLPAFLGTGIGRLDLEGDGWGWRAGVAYEIPDIALRASLVYNSAVKLDNLSGTLDLTQVPAFIDPTNPILGRVTDVYGFSEVPQSVELKLQSGIAPGWLAFGSIKWVDWSVLQSIPFCPTSTKGLLACTTTSPVRATSLDLLYRDGWTVSAGIGHKFNDQWSGAAGISWDRGTTTGLSAQTDTWTVSAGVAYTPTKNVELRFGGALGVLTSGHIHSVVGSDGVTYGTDYTADFGNDLVSAISGSVKVKW
ncbi:OmpP1/FadL family transporter [Mesorhizobium sp. M2E.F.Ca.ET.219.01.1.1]|uniref:OmpP1/FadL family transporter n=1 Tax=Mesorhizobium sp. M2E.F.Ca.ET.219.01.1.1 TaxID=2500530 RepID=UPI000FD98B44|nr:OmpP1/FadL family transporter [Mesorhizobium sp. M2E.F.Ca.ET.219.01.1.1]RWL48155.1 MAG: transporter [Mesorhizobium sp.]TGQ17347.1 transporter [Mesorhizobium sp. M2E.F.Ca.ET.219.01.1.1]